MLANPPALPPLPKTTTPRKMAFTGLRLATRTGPRTSLACSTWYALQHVVDSVWFDDGRFVRVMRSGSMHRCDGAAVGCGGAGPLRQENTASRWSRPPWGLSLAGSLAETQRALCDAAAVAQDGALPALVCRFTSNLLPQVGNAWEWVADEYDTTMENVQRMIQKQEPSVSQLWTCSHVRCRPAPSASPRIAPERQGEVH